MRNAVSRRSFAARVSAALLVALLQLLAPSPARSDTPDYVFATSTSGSLTDMANDTTLLVGGTQDDAVSALTPIGFDFYMLGGRNTTFGVSSNGALRLGGVPSATQYALGATGVSLVACMLSDNYTSLNGGVHYKLTGTAPNRVLTVEFANLTIIYDGAGATADGTCQIRLHETTGQIELVYGAMRRNASSGFNGGLSAQHIGFSGAGFAGTIASVSTSNTVSTTGATPNQFPLGAAMASLNSPVQGSRRLYTFTPAVPNAPTALSFSGVSAFSMTLTWADSSNELLYAVYRSTDGVNYSFQSTVPANTTSFNATSLSPSTTYFWRVFSVSDGAFSTALAGTQATTGGGNVASTAAGGPWSANATWVGGNVPTANDNVTIVNGATVTVDTAAVALSVAVGTGGGAGATLTYDPGIARTLTVGTSVSIATNGVLSGPATGTVTTHAMSVGTDLTNNGTLDLSTNANTAGVGLTFTGPTDTTFGGAGTTDLRALTVNKGTSRAPVLELTTGSFTVLGVNTDAGGWLTLTSGTLKVSGSFTATSRVFAGAAAYAIPASAGFWLNNPNFTVAGQNGTATLNGLLRVTQGTFTVGTAAGNSLGFGNGSTVLVEGGAVNTTGRFGVNTVASVFTYTQTAGTVTTCTVGNASTVLACFDLGTALGSTITINGGTIVVQIAGTGASGPRDYRNQAGTGLAGVTGGTLQLGNAASGAAKAFNLRGVVPNLVLTNTSANHTAAFDTTLVNFNNLSLNVTINAGTTLNFGNVVFLFNGTTLTNNGTLTHTGASSSFVFFLATAPVLYTGSGTVTAPMSNLAIQADQGLTISAASPVIVASAVQLFSGSVINASRITVGNGTTATVQIGNTVAPTAAGTFDSQLGFNATTIALSYFRTFASRSTGMEVPPGRAITTFTRDDFDTAHTLTLAGGDLLVSGVTTLTNGRVITGANALAIGPAGSVTQTGGYVDGNLRKTYTAIANKTFEVGSASGYTPVAFNVTAGAFPTDITVKSTETTAPGFTPAAKALTRYWTLTATGVTSDLTFNYLDADVPGTLTEAGMHLYRGGAGSYTDVGGTLTPAANTATLAGVTTYSDWTLGAPGGGSSIGNLTISPPTGIAFGNQRVGTTGGPTAVTLGNSGSASLMVTSFDAAAAPFSRVGGNCPAAAPFAIGAGNSCTLSYQFAPSAAGLATQPIAVAADSPGGGSFQLSGTGIQGHLTIAGSPVAFGAVSVGATGGPLTAILGNDGTDTLAVTVLTAAAAPFARSGGTCTGVPISIAANTSCTLTYTFAPSARGAASQPLTVTADQPGGGGISLTGTGVQGNLTVAPTTRDYGTVPVGSTSAFNTVALGNDGDDALTVTALDLAAPPFTRTGDGSCGNSLPLNIAIGASCTLSYTLTPAAVGPVFQDFVLTSAATGTKQYRLQGTGAVVNDIFKDGFE